MGDRKVSVAKRALGRPSAPTFAFLCFQPGARSRPSGGGVPARLGRGESAESYGAWIDHLVRQGWLVLFPRFQEVNRTKPSDAPATAASLVKAALGEVADDKEAKPDLSRVAMIGHRGARRWPWTSPPARRRTGFRPRS